MDPITHAASGAVAMLAMPSRPTSRWAVPLAALAAASPDIDVALAHSPMQFLLLHRGFTHSLAFAPVLGLILTLLGWALWRKATPSRWGFGKTWLFMTAMILLHIWLDCITTYGTMIFVPFSHLRVRLNAVFIIDFLLTLPLLWAIWRWRARRGLMLLAFAWMFAYPAISIGLNALHTVQAQERLAAQGQNVNRLVVLPDAFAPLFWRVLYEEDGAQGPQVHSQGINALGRPRGPVTTDPALPPDMARALARQSVVADAFLDFTLLPVVSPLPEEFLPSGAAHQESGAAETAVTAAARYVMVYDLRFGSSLDFVRRLMALRPSAEIPFKYMAEIAPANQPGQSGTGSRWETAGNFRLVRERLRFSDSRRDSLWQNPHIALAPSRLQWLAGLR